MLSLSKHPCRNSNPIGFNEAAEMLRQAQHDGHTYPRIAAMPFLNRLLLALLLTSALFRASAQSTAFTKDSFGDNKDGLREALRELKASDEEHCTCPPARPSPK